MFLYASRFERIHGTRWRRNHTRNILGYKKYALGCKEYASGAYAPERLPERCWIYEIPQSSVIIFSQAYLLLLERSPRSPVPKAQKR